jgi:hypothetical protein
MVDEQGLSPFQQIDGEEPAAAGNERTTIVWHGEQDSTGLTGGAVGDGGLRLRLIRPTLLLSQGRRLMVLCPTGKSMRAAMARVSSPSAENKSLRAYPKSNLDSRRPASQRGVSRSSRT